MTMLYDDNHVQTVNIKALFHAGMVTYFLAMIPVAVYCQQMGATHTLYVCVRNKKEI